MAAGSLSGEIGAGRKLEVTFRRPSPPIPFHGSERETIHKEPRFVMLPEQLGWLKQSAFDHSTGEALMRPVVAYQAMKVHFRNRLRQDTKTPMWLEKHQIAKWLAEQKKEEKEKRKRERTSEKTTDTNKKGKRTAGGGKRKEPPKGSEEGNKKSKTRASATAKQ